MRAVLQGGKGPTDRASDIPPSSGYWEGASCNLGADELAHPASSLVVTFRGLLRELELANARLAHPEFSRLKSEKLATLSPPTSKGDIGGSGVSRSSKCTCEVPVLRSASLPSAHLGESSGVEGQGVGGGPQLREAWDVPPFQCRDGGIPGEEAVAQAW